MAQNPLFPTSNDSSEPASPLPDAALAADLIRQKVSRLYDDEPNAVQEQQESEAATRRSPHQQFMHQLSTSGKDLATIQTEWHNYYQQLSDVEKHQVWQEFYQSQSTVTGLPGNASEDALKIAEHKHQVVNGADRGKKLTAKPHNGLRDARTTAQIQASIRDTVTGGGKLKAKHHLQSLLFGLSMGAVVVIIFLFSFFNEVIIAPFIQPSRVSAATPLIVDSSSVAPTATPEVIIPKINVEIPVNYTETTTNESAIENDLEDGVVHYPSTVMPGQNGNAAFFGHSSNNIFNKGKYKFAFVLLHTLVPGDTFYLTYNSKVYVYKVISRNIVPPTDVGVLGPVQGQTATATLITCDPPGTSINRLVVVGQQISPDVSANTAAPQSTPTASSNTKLVTLPGNGPTLMGRLLRTVIGKAIAATVILVIIYFASRWFRAVMAGRYSGVHYA